MTNQTSLFSMVKVVAKTKVVDIPSSHGYRNPVVHSGGPESEVTPPDSVRVNNCNRVLERLKLRPGSTARELYYYSVEFFDGRGIDKYEVSRRLTDLKEAGTIEQGEVRLCIASQKKGVTWWLK